MEICDGGKENNCCTENVLKTPDVNGEIIAHRKCLFSNTLPVLGHFCGTNCRLKFETARMQQLLSSSSDTPVQASFQICFNISNSFNIFNISSFDRCNVFI